MSVYFEAPWDTTLKTITYGVVAFLLLETIVGVVVVTASLMTAVPVSDPVVLGNGGLFGYSGSFRKKELGSLKMYATHGDLGVLIDTDRNCVLPPERPEDFMEVGTFYVRDSWS